MPEIYALFQTAIKEGWEPDKFGAEVRKSDWYKTNANSARDAIALEGTDPAEYARRLQAKTSMISTLAAQLGAPISDTTLSQLAKNALTLGWSEGEIRSSLGAIYDSAQPGMTGQSQGQVGLKLFGGETAAALRSIRTMYDDYGVPIDDATLGQYVGQIVAGKMNIETVKSSLINKYATQMYPAWADELKNGHTVKDIATPYMQLMAQTLEINPNEIDLKDPTMKQALQSIDANGKPTTKPMWQFEQELKSDPRWNKTKNAESSLMGAGQQVLKDWGLSS